MTRLLTLTLAVTLLVLAGACGDDDSAPLPTETTPAVTETPTPTPLDQYVCDADVPEVRLESAGVSQAALPLVSEWTGPDCVNGGPGHTYYYLPTEALEVTGQSSPTLILASEPEDLFLVAWSADFADASVIASGETLLVMDPINRPRRNSPTALDVESTSEQQLDLSDLSAGEYALEILGTWPDGVATLSLHIVVTD